MVTSLQKILLVAVAAGSALPGWGSDEKPMPDRIDFASPQLYPESVSWSQKSKVFLVGSLRRGTVGRVSMDGRYRDFIRHEKLVSTTGVLADDAHDRVWVANADPDAHISGVGVFDATSGAMQAYYDLASLVPGRHFANDIAVDDEGNAYVTDSFMPIIYRIGVDGQASIFAQNDAFGTAEGFNLNGIAWHKAGYLIVGNTMTGKLLRVDIANPSTPHSIDLPSPLQGADGIHLLDDQHLVIAQQHLAFPQRTSEDRAVQLVSTDNWRSATIDRQAKSVVSSPTSATSVKGQVYLLNSRIDTLNNPDAARVSRFTLQRF